MPGKDRRNTVKKVAFIGHVLDRMSHHIHFVRMIDSLGKNEGSLCCGVGRFIDAPWERQNGEVATPRPATSGLTCVITCVQQYARLRMKRWALGTLRYGTILATSGQYPISDAVCLPSDAALP